MRQLLALALSLAACSPAGSSTSPNLGAVLSRVDVPSLIECGLQLPDYAAAARCLGAQALTQGLKLAIDSAHDLAERAQEAAGPTGADDMTDAERAALAADLDAALGRLAIEIDATVTQE
jgi:thiazole synthase ThiGH ThiG subunit